MNEYQRMTNSLEDFIEGFLIVAAVQELSFPEHCIDSEDDISSGHMSTAVI